MRKPGRVLILGATGYIGKHIVRASLHSGHPTFLLVRPDVASDVSKIQQLISFKKSGASLLEGSIHDYSGLVSVLKQVDIVISAIGEDRLLDQLKLIEAMKEAGNIQRFLPSEYGMDADRLLHCARPGGDIFMVKRQIRRAVEAAGIPYTYVSANCFAGYFLGGLAQYGRFLPPTDGAVIYGDGNQKVIWVEERDVAAYVMEIVEDPRTVNTTVYIRPPENILSQNEVVGIWEELSGKVLPKTQVHQEEWLKKIEDSDSLYHKASMGHFYHIFYLGELHFDIGPSAKEASELYPNVKYTSAKAYLRDFL